MEYLDIYDENQNHLGKELRDIVHRDALWHKTVHCWLYDKDGNIFFQIRKDEGTLYTTASGHIKAGETIEIGFQREIKEEIGINIDYNKVTPVDTIKFTLDRQNQDGTMFRDRAFANVNICIYEGDYNDFNFDKNEVLGVVKVNAQDTLKLFEGNIDKIKGEKITNTDSKVNIIEEEFSLKDFLVNDGETAIGKYGDVLNKVIELTK